MPGLYTTLVNDKAIFEWYTLLLNELNAPELAPLSGNFTIELLKDNNGSTRVPDVELDPNMHGFRETYYNEDYSARERIRNQIVSRLRLVL